MNLITKMNIPHSCTWHGQAITPDEDGTASVPNDAVEDLKSHGCTVFVKDAPVKNLGVGGKSSDQIIGESEELKALRAELEEFRAEKQKRLNAELVNAMRAKNDVREFADKNKISLDGVADKLEDLKAAAIAALSK